LASLGGHGDVIRREVHGLLLRPLKNLKTLDNPKVLGYPYNQRGIFDFKVSFLGLKDHKNREKKVMKVRV